MLREAINTNLAGSSRAEYRGEGVEAVFMAMVANDLWSHKDLET